MEHKPGVVSIIATDFKDIAVFSPPTHHSAAPTYERISSSQPAQALRIVSAAILASRLPYDFLIRPELDIEINTDLILPEGPPQDPGQPFMSDEAVFATHCTNSDFDVPTLVRDNKRAAQFFRWHAQVQTRYSKVVAHPDDVLSAATNKVGLFWATMELMHPICPFDVSEIPAETIEHIESVRRDSPLAATGIADDLARSKGFTLRILDVISGGSKRGICTVYSCQITSVDDKPVMSPPLCLKLFDDRFLPVGPLEEGEDPQDEPGGLRWFDRLILAEGCAVSEATSYNKLQPVQGSIVPWFYGVHQVGRYQDHGSASRP